MPELCPPSTVTSSASIKTDADRSPFRGCAANFAITKSWARSHLSKSMSTQVQGKATLRCKRAGLVALEDDRCVLGVIFTTVALTGLCVA